ITILFLLLTAIGSLFPSDIVVTRAIKIERPADSISQYIDVYENWNDWMAGAKTSDMKAGSMDGMKAFFRTMFIRLVGKKNHEWQHEWTGRGLLQLSVFRIFPIDSTSCNVQWQFKQHVRW